MNAPYCSPDYRFENAILNEFKKFFDDKNPLPDYLNDPKHARYNNSNTFAN